MHLEILNRKRIGKRVTQCGPCVAVVEIITLDDEHELFGAEAFVAQAQRGAPTATARVHLIEQIIEIIEEEFAASLHQQIMPPAFEVKLPVFDEPHIAGGVKSFIVEDRFATDIAGERGWASHPDLTVDDLQLGAGQRKTAADDLLIAALGKP